MEKIKNTPAKSAGKIKQQIFFSSASLLSVNRERESKSNDYLKKTNETKLNPGTVYIMNSNIVKSPAAFKSVTKFIRTIIIILKSDTKFFHSHKKFIASAAAILQSATLFKCTTNQLIHTVTLFCDSVVQFVTPTTFFNEAVAQFLKSAMQFNYAVEQFITTVR